MGQRRGKGYSGTRALTRRGPDGKSGRSAKAAAAAAAPHARSGKPSKPKPTAGDPRGHAQPTATGQATQPMPRGRQPPACTERRAWATRGPPAAGSDPSPPSPGSARGQGAVTPTGKASPALESVKSSLGGATGARRRPQRPRPSPNPASERAWRRRLRRPAGWQRRPRGQGLCGPALRGVSAGGGGGGRGDGWGGVGGL